MVTQPRFEPDTTCLGRVYIFIDMNNTSGGGGVRNSWVGMTRVSLSNLDGADI
jgi:hypothetical protein